jgi:Cof subfamily protein (haloacid dehalogenase superfamily)
MEQKMKILGSDWDGTFLHGGIDEKKLLAVKKWRDAGNKFGIVTGRAPDFRDRLIEYYPNFEYDFLATCNGGYIIDGGGYVLYKSSFESLDVPTLVGDLFSWGCIYAFIVANEQICAVTYPDARPKYIDPSRAFLLEDLPSVTDVYQVSVMLESAEEAEIIVGKLRESYGGILNPLRNSRCIDIVPCGVNKAEGLYRLTEIFGANPSDVIAVGDNINDVDMLREFRSFAMENGVEQIKGLVDGTVGDVTEILINEI